MKYVLHAFFLFFSTILLAQSEDTDFGSRPYVNWKITAEKVRPYIYKLTFIGKLSKNAILIADEFAPRLEKLGENGQYIVGRLARLHGYDCQGIKAIQKAKVLSFHPELQKRLKNPSHVVASQKRYVGQVGFSMLFKMEKGIENPHWKGSIESKIIDHEGFSTSSSTDDFGLRIIPAKDSLKTISIGKERYQVKLPASKF